MVFFGPELSLGIVHQVAHCPRYELASKMLWSGSLQHPTKSPIRILVTSAVYMDDGCGITSVTLQGCAVRCNGSLGPRAKLGSIDK